MKPLHAKKKQMPTAQPGYDLYRSLHILLKTSAFQNDFIL
jgi:hypothetical protein